jgi:hypothetical protein
MAFTFTFTGEISDFSALLDALRATDATPLEIEPGAMTDAPRSVSASSGGTQGVSAIGFQMPRIEGEAE